MFEFRSDGTVDFSPGAVVQMPWRIESNQLILPPDTVDGGEQKYTLKWVGDDKLRLEAEAGVMELVRVGNRADAVNPIIGEWVEYRDMGGRTLVAHRLFYTNGKLLFVMPFALQQGSYTISGSALHLKVPGLDPQFKFKLADSRLTLFAPTGGYEFRYARY